MKVKVVIYVLMGMLSASCIPTKNKNYTFNQKYSATAIKSDIALLKKILEANHPSLYWYTPKDSIDYFFKQTINSITDSLTELQVKNKIAAVISNIKCGHTSVRYSNQFVALADKYKYPQFPLSIKVWKDSMVVLARYNLEDSILQRGTVITAINNKKTTEMIENIFRLIPSDGNANNYKSQAVSGNFPAWYRNAFGVDSVYTIDFIDSMNQAKSINIKWFNPIPDTTKKKFDTTKAIVKEVPKKIAKKQQKINKLLSYRSLLIDTSMNTAFIKLATFSKGNLRCFYRNTFSELKEKHIKNIVIDLRENGGGSVASSILLLQYLKDSAFKIADTVAAVSRKFEYGNHIKNWFIYWLMMHIAATKKSDGLIHNRFYETHYYEPKTSHHFDGNIYIIQGGYTFSAATILSSFLKGQNNVTIVGEESGGGFYGNTAMHIPNIILPNIKLQVRLPMFRYVMDTIRPKGRGVMPDIEIYPSSAAIKNGVDLKMEAVRKLIKEKRPL
jgi:hypothetical protein